MALVNENFLELPQENMFSRICKEVERLKLIHPSWDIIDLSANDVTLPLGRYIVKQMHMAVDEMAGLKNVHDHSLEQGSESLREAIIKEDYNNRGIHLTNDEIFINDGIKNEIGNIGEVLGADNTVGVVDPVYPVYVESNVVFGRAGIFRNGHWSNVCYVKCKESDNFSPKIPDSPIDIVYICSPNNPTGMAMSKSQLKRWVDYALKNKTLILFDATYESYIQSPGIPHSIYEIRGAKKVAIELRSFSHTAGFTGLRCGYTVIPHELKIHTLEGKTVFLNSLWSNRQRIRFNGVSHLIQSAAAAIYLPEGKAEVEGTINYYMQNVLYMRRQLSSLGFRVYGGEHVPYLWMKIPAQYTSWEYFRQMLYGANVSCIPGTAFGPSGEGFVRLSAFTTRENCEEAVERLKKWL